MEYRLLMRFSPSSTADSAPELEIQFGFKIIEYLWRRETKKHGIDPFERILSAIRHVFERAEKNPTIYAD
jgi:hypothetical protein